MRDFTEGHPDRVAKKTDEQFHVEGFRGMQGRWHRKNYYTVRGTLDSVDIYSNTDNICSLDTGSTSQINANSNLICDALPMLDILSNLVRKSESMGIGDENPLAFELDRAKHIIEKHIQKW